MGKVKLHDSQKKKIDEFKRELKALIDKYNFGIYESDNYNSMEEYIGSDYNFIVYGGVWYEETIQEILNGAMRKI